MCKRAAALWFVALSAAGADAAPLSDPTLARFLEICRSSTVSEAAAKGDAHGWVRISREKAEEWQESFVAYNGGSVALVGWQGSGKENDDLVSFWAAKGPNAHKACSYSSTGATGHLDTLTNAFGTPDSLDKYDFGVGAYWQREAIEISFSQVGSSTGITIAYKD